MNIKTKFALVVLAVSFVLSGDAKAQVFKRRNAKNEQTPKFVLVQLNTYSNRIKVYEKAKNSRYATLARTDAQEMTKKMVADFNDNFKFCSFYFYYDTNATLIKERKFEGILLNEKLQPVSGNAISVSDSNYRIIVWGLNSAVAQDYNNGTNPNDPFDGNYSIGTQTHRLIVLYPDFKRVKSPEPDGLELVAAGKSKQKNSFYKYTSPKFNIYYKARAKQLSQAMEDFFK
jgi:hypothetical protein